MNDVIDLGRHVRAVVRRWPIVLGLLVVGALVGFVVSQLLPPVYEAGTTLLITTPKLRTDFDSRFQSTLELGLSTSLNRTFLNLIMNRELEARVVEAMGDRLSAEERLPGVLLERIEAVLVGGDTSYLQIKARHEGRELARDLANTWAALYIAQVNELYGFPTEAVDEIAQSMVKAEAGLRTAEDALQSFQAETGIGLVDNIQYPATLSRQAGLTDVRNLFGLYERYGAAGNALETKNLTLGEYLAASDTLQLLTEEADTLQSEGEATGADLPLELIQKHDVLVARGRLDPADLADRDVGDVRDLLAEEADALDEVIDALSADLADHQAYLAQQHQRLADLIRQRQLAEESYIIFALKEAEIATEMQVQDSWLAIVSRARLPREPVSPQPLLDTAIGGVLGGLLGVLAALILPRRPTRVQSPEA